MYILPLLFSNLHLGMDAPFSSMDPTFGRTNLVRPEGLVSRVLDRYYPINFDHGILDFYYRPGRDLLNRKPDITSSAIINDTLFMVTVQSQQFKPEEITVKVVGHTVIIEGKHVNEPSESNVISQQVKREYTLPSNADMDRISSTRSSDGVLTVTVPMKPVEERVIKIEQTGQPAVSSNNQDSDRNKILTTDSSNSQAGASEATEKKAENNKAIREDVTATQT